MTISTQDLRRLRTLIETAEHHDHEWRRGWGHCTGIVEDRCQAAREALSRRDLETARRALTTAASLEEQHALTLVYPAGVALAELERLAPAPAPLPRPVPAPVPVVVVKPVVTPKATPEIAPAPVRPAPVVVPAPVAFIASDLSEHHRRRRGGRVLLSDLEVARVKSLGTLSAVVRALGGSNSEYRAIHRATLAPRKRQALLKDFAAQLLALTPEQVRAHEWTGVQPQDGTRQLSEAEIVAIRAKGNVYGQARAAGIEPTHLHRCLRRKGTRARLLAPEIARLLALTPEDARKERQRPATLLSTGACLRCGNTIPRCSHAKRLYCSEPCKALAHKRRLKAQRERAK